MNWVTIKYSRKCTGTVKLLTWLPRCLAHTGQRNDQSERLSDMTWSLIKVTIPRSISSLWMLNLNSWKFQAKTSFIESNNDFMIEFPQKESQFQLLGFLYWAVSIWTFHLVITTVSSNNLIVVCLPISNH